MRKLMVALAALALVLACPAGIRTAYAHGGQYRGPAGEVPPDSRQPEDPPPPDTGGGTPTPPDGGGGTPTPPGGDGGGTPTPPDGGGTPEPPAGAGGGVPQPGTGGGPSTKTGGKLPAKKGPSYESWLFWWNYNKDEIINLKKAVRSGAVRTVTGLTTVASSGNDNETAAQDITARAVETRVVPVLRAYAENSKVNFDIQSAAVIGLAKIGRKEFSGLMMKMAKNDGAEQYHKVVEESAALALGILQDRSPAVRDFLSTVATDKAAKVRTRCFSAFALGLLGDRDAAPGANAKSLDVLKSLVAGDEASRDIANSALVAIGLLGDPSAVPELISWLNDEKAGAQKLNDVNLSYAAAALGKIGQPGVSGPDSREVIEALRDQLKKKNRMTRYSTIIALGQIGPQCSEKLQAECVSMLMQVIKSEGKSGFDTQSVNFALTSIGRIAGVPAGSDGKGGCPVSVRQKAMGQLMETFQGKSQTRPFAALALGLLARDLPEPEKIQVSEVIRTTLAKTSGDVEARGALVISLGLLKDIQSAPVLQALLQDKGLDKKLRGTAAVSLGLIGERGALDTIRNTLKEKEDRELRVDAAIAAGLLKDNEAVPALVDTLRDPKASQFILGSVATALGQIGDERALDPLTQILGDEQYPELTRALAAVALGQIGDKTDIPVMARISTDVNYRAYYDAIGELLTII